jgi:hypothetical protein
MRLTSLKKSKRSRNDAGIALLTTLLLLFLMSSLLVGFCVLLYSNQKISGSNDQQVRAFYAAEAGMEQLTAGLGNLFDQTYSPSTSQINNLEATQPPIPGISYTKGDGTPGFLITPQAVDANGNPAPTITTISSGNYQGMTAMATTYTLMVNARTASGQEVTLKRTTQTVGIPMFQFGIWSDNDMDFFPGPNFNFGGRTHTNGNLFLGGGSLLQFSDKVDAYKDVIRDQLENGHPTSAGYTGTVNITVSPGGSTYRALGLTEGSLSGYPVGTPTAYSGWQQLSMGAAPANYAGNLQNGAGANKVSKQYSGAAKQLNLGIVTIGGGSTQPIDLIRRPVPGEGATITAERYFAQASLKILLSDDKTDIMNLPCVDPASNPIDLSTLAGPPAGWTGPGATLYANMNAAGTGYTPLPLGTSGASGAAYTGSDGYYIPNGYPIQRGFLLIEAQKAPYTNNPCSGWKDVTLEILALGYTGRNIDPVSQSLDGSTLNPQWIQNTNFMETGQSPATPYLPQVAQASGTNKLVALSYQNGTSFTTGTALFTGPTATCSDLHPNAILRFQRVRDNPSTVPVATGALVPSGSKKNVPLVATVAQVCGYDPGTNTVTPGLAANSANFWPNVLFDPREGTLRDVALSSSSSVTSVPAGGPFAVVPPLPSVNGAMQYIELDAKNLTRWFAGQLGASGNLTFDSIVAPNNFVVYFSDRRGNYTANTPATSWPPLSFTKHETGEYGWDDIVNQSSATKGCPDGILDVGEDIDSVNTLLTYGADTTYTNFIQQPGVAKASLKPGQIGLMTGLSGTALVANNQGCALPSYLSSIWPMSLASNPDSLRENPSLFFRRALKVVNGSDLSSLPQCPSGIICGLTIASENPVYVQGDFNANGGFSASAPATSIAGDAVTLLSDQWNDVNSFSSPYSTALRNATTAYYNTAVIGGITVPFLNPSGTGQDYGTDGGVHNFLRYIEAWGGKLNYQGSIIELFTSRQAMSTFKCCSTVYSPPTRGYSFNINFLNPTLLPPRTPLFRDVNTTGWTRLLLPGQYN